MSRVDIYIFFEKSLLIRRWFSMDLMKQKRSLECLISYLPGSFENIWDWCMKKNDDSRICESFHQATKWWWNMRMSHVIIEILASWNFYWQNAMVDVMSFKTTQRHNRRMRFGMWHTPKVWKRTGKKRGKGGWRCGDVYDFCFFL